jgi:lambda family phage tail tape measure protein
MPANSNTLTLTIQVDDKGSLKVKRFADETDRAGRDIERAADRAGGRFDRMATSVSRGYGLIATAIAGLASSQAFAIIDRMIQQASDLEEMTSKFNVVFAGQQTYARQTAEMLVKYYGMSTREARQYLSSVQDLLVPMGANAAVAARLSGEIVKLSADLGSFNNLPTAQVMGDIQSALVGQYETMKKYGIVMGEEIVQRQALNLGLGKTKDELTAGEKAYAAFTIMVRDSQAAIGDKMRTMDSYANKLKDYHAAWEDTGAALGKAFLPAASAVVDKLRQIALGLQALMNPSVQQQFEKLADAAGAGARFYESPMTRGGLKYDEPYAQYMELRRRRHVYNEQAFSYGLPPEAAAKPGGIDMPAVRPSDFQDRSGGASNGASKAKKKGLWDGWGVRPYTESEAVLADQAAYDAWKKNWSTYDQRGSQESEAVLADQKAFEDWKEKTEKAFDAVTELSARTAERMQDNFSDLFFDAFTGKLKSLEDYATAIFQSIQRAAADIAGQMATQAIFGGKSVGGAGGGGGLLSGLLESVGGWFSASAHGNVFGPSGIQAFARGGVVTRPTVFPFAGGWGLMGEAGWEGILPLARTSSGDLGVKADGGGGGGDVYHVYHITAMDSQSVRDALVRSGAVPYILGEELDKGGALRSKIMGGIN